MPARPASTRRRPRMRRRPVVVGVLAAVVLVAAGISGCAPAGSLRITIVNTSVTLDDDVYVMVTGNGTVQATPSGVVGASVPLTTLQAVQGSPHTYALYLSPGISAGLIWLSFGAPVSNSPRPDVNTSTTRFANVELA